MYFPVETDSEKLFVLFLNPLGFGLPMCAAGHMTCAAGHMACAAGHMGLRMRLCSKPSSLYKGLDEEAPGSPFQCHVSTWCVSVSRSDTVLSSLSGGAFSSASGIQTPISHNLTHTQTLLPPNRFSFSLVLSKAPSRETLPSLAPLLQQAHR